MMAPCTFSVCAQIAIFLRTQLKNSLPSSNNMATIILIKEAITALKDRTGSSPIAINKWIESEKKQTVKPHIMKAALKRGVETGTLVKVKASYKVSAEAKKAATKKPAAPKAKAVVKKATTETKKVTKKTVAKKKTAPVKKASAPKKTKKATPAKKTTAKKAKTAPKKKAAAPKKVKEAKQ
eukprot:Nitzschia sp. Nitz4//scaffold7_size249615//18182//19339//NITZ4_001139-RA/size249615-augustus-gene-0.18-mRNA-1//-1//CDS//3329558328//477//frame0